VAQDIDTHVWHQTLGVFDLPTYLDDMACFDASRENVSEAVSPLSRYLFNAYRHPTSFRDEESDHPVFYVVLDADRYIDDPDVTRHLKQIAQSGVRHPGASRTVVLVSQSGDIPDDLKPYAEFFEYGVPNGDELRSLLQSYESELRSYEREVMFEEARQSKNRKLTEPERRRVEANFEPSFTLPTDRDGETIPQSFITACSGLTRYQIREAVLTLFSVKNRVLEEDLIEYRRRRAEQSDLLEFVDTERTYDDVAGLEHQKDWLRRVGAAFTEQGRQWGLVPPKGLLQVGIPGCGKSLTAKATANEWNLPLVRLDAGRVFTSKVGQSERNMRKALRTVESMAPVILWLDEIEKGLSGVQSSGQSDAGTTSRVVGTFLTWFEEHSSDIFLIATSNDITQVPSELVGRFDEVFFVDLPNDQARRECFRLHLERYWTESMGDIRSLDWDRLADASEHFTGREIDQVVRESLRRGFEEGEMTTEVIESVLKEKPPIVTTMQEEIARLVNWVGYDADTQRGVRARLASDQSTMFEQLTGDLD
jgi:SpoVK/Ycf46/Vps4 family AAA+-type ATPase